MELPLLLGLCVVVAAQSWNAPLRVEFGTNISPHVVARLTSHLKPFSTILVPEGFHGVCISLGNTSAAMQFIDSVLLDGLGPEGFVVQSNTSLGELIITANGNSRNILTSATSWSIGAMYGQICIV
jgi:hypothetical protein